MVDPEFPVSLVDVDEQPLPGPDWARVDVALAGICGSDLHNVFPDGSGSRIFGPFVGVPMEMGHEVSGTIVEAGPECPFPVGTDVAVDPTLACAARGLEACPMCAVGAYSSCHHLGSKAFTPGFGLGFTVGLGGAWGEQLLAHVSQLHALPAGVDLHTAVLTEPLSVSVHGLLRRPPPPAAARARSGGGAPACGPARRSTASRCSWSVPASSASPPWPGCATWCRPAR